MTSDVALAPRRAPRIRPSRLRLVPTSGTVTFAPDQVMANIDVPLIDDALFEGMTSFDVVLFDPIGASFAGTTQFASPTSPIES